MQRVVKKGVQPSDAPVSINLRRPVALDLRYMILPAATDLDDEGMPVLHDPLPRYVGWQREHPLAHGGVPYFGERRPREAHEFDAVDRDQASARGGQRTLVGHP